MSTFMESSPNPTADSHCYPSPTTTVSADQRLTNVSTLIDHLDVEQGAVSAADVPSEVEVRYQNQLAQVRLGVASSLFIALRAKHAPTAAHCLRVALGCSSWSLLLDLEDQHRDELEVAALLHDIGKIGVPDRLLLKPAKLTTEEAATITRHRAIGEQILLSCCASQEVLNIVKYAPAWYDGSQAGFRLASAATCRWVPRICSIIDAFDAMTTNQVYRRAMSRERAMVELFECAGTQFDPDLVEQFCDFLATDQIKLSAEMSRRWLKELSSDRSNAFWEWKQSASGSSQDPCASTHCFTRSCSTACTTESSSSTRICRFCCGIGPPND